MALKPAYRDRVVPFTAGDGLTCNLVHVEGDSPASRGPVLLVHGAGVRGDIFRAPVRTNIVDYLIAHGYDVWLENWRGSIDLPPNPWTLDQAAVYDHPMAVKTVVRETGAAEIKAVIHCQGSTSFMMSAVAGLVPEVTTIVSNAVSLHPVVPKWSVAKLKYAVPMVHSLTPYMSPRWGVQAPTLTAKLFSLFARATHHECDNTVCRLVSFIYGSGFPALWSHANLSDETHEWLKGEFAEVSLEFFRQIRRCVEAGHLVSVENHGQLPRDFIAQPPQTDARFAFLTGLDNRCFLPESQKRTFDYFNSLRRDRHSLWQFAGYGHLDVFMGENAARDTFPIILQELDKPN